MSRDLENGRTFRFHAACAPCSGSSSSRSAPELKFLHRWLDTWTGVGLIAVGVERQGYRLTLSHTVEGEWRTVFTRHNPLIAPEGVGVADPVAGGVDRGVVGDQGIVGRLRPATTSRIPGRGQEQHRDG